MDKKNLESKLAAKLHFLTVGGGALIGATGGYKTLQYLTSGSIAGAIVLGCTAAAGTLMLLSPTIAYLVEKYRSNQKV